MSRTAAERKRMAQHFEDARNILTRCEDRLRNRTEHGQTTESLRRVVVEEAARVVREMTLALEILTD